MNEFGDHPVTELLHEWDSGSEIARDRLFRLLYDDLRVLAHRQRQKRLAHHTLNTTALVHEVYLKLAGGADVGFEDRGHFAALATKALRCVLVDYARRMQRQKRGGAAEQVTFDEAAGGPVGSLPAVEAEAADILALHDALDELAALDPAMAEIVEMHFFAGLSYDEIAEVRGVSKKTVYRTVAKAKALIRLRLGD